MYVSCMKESGYYSELAATIFMTPIDVELHCT